MESADSEETQNKLHKYLTPLNDCKKVSDF